MTRIWTEGWELKDTVGYITTSGSVSTSAKRSGSASFQLSGGTGILDSVAKSFTATSEIYLRYAFYVQSGLSPYNQVSWRKGTTVIGKVEYSSGYNVITAGALSDTGIINIILDTWYLLEVHIKIDNAAGVIEVKLDGNADCDVSGDTQPGADTTIDNILIQGGYYGRTTYLDDMAINDTAGGVDDGWCGDGKIIMLTPNDDVTTELTQYPALTDHHADVDDYPADGDTTYVEGSVVDEEDKYELTASGLVAADVASINRVWCEARSKNTTANPGEVALFIYSDATEGTGTDVVLGSSYTTKVMSQEFLQDPDGPAAWSVAALDALQGGIRTRD